MRVWRLPNDAVPLDIEFPFLTATNSNLKCYVRHGGMEERGPAHAERVRTQSYLSIAHYTAQLAASQIFGVQ